jgi:hypothetical protein
MAAAVDGEIQPIVLAETGWTPGHHGVAQLTLKWKLQRLMIRIGNRGIQRCVAGITLGMQCGVFPGCTRAVAGLTVQTRMGAHERKGGLSVDPPEIPNFPGIGIMTSRTPGPEGALMGILMAGTARTICQGKITNVMALYTWHPLMCTLQHKSGPTVIKSQRLTQGTPACFGVAAIAGEVQVVMGIW